jgi:hypothetical protein
MTERTKPLVVTSIDSAEESKPPRLNCQDNFAGSGIIDVITPPISLVWLTPEVVVGPATGPFRVVCNLQGLCCFQPTKPSPLQFKVK